MDFRQRLEQSRVHLVEPPLPEPDDNFTSPYFAIDRGKNPVCLDLHLADGSRKAVPYVYFTEMNFDAEIGIEILTAQKRICITGRNLAKLFDHLIIYRVRYVKVDFGSDLAEDGLFVQEININDL